MNAVGVVDVGSTNLSYVAATPTGEFLTAVESEPTRPYELRTQLGRAVETLTDAASLEAVSIVVPGLVDAERGSVRRFDTADGDVIDRIEIATPLRERCGLPVFLEGVDRYLEEYLFVDRPTIRESPLGEELGLYGALSVALDRAEL